MKKEKQKPKKEILPSWDLSDGFYKGLDDPQITEDKRILKSLSEELETYKDCICFLQPFELSVLLHKYECMVTISQKLLYYVFLYADTNKTDEHITQFKSKMEEDVLKYFSTLGFIHFELNDLPYEKMEEFLNHPKLAKWIPYLKDIFGSYWAINEGASFIIGQKSIVSSAWDRLYGETCAKLRFTIDNKTYTDSEISGLLTSPSQEIREKAIKEMNRVYKENAHVLTMCYNMILKNYDVDNTLYGIRESKAGSISSNKISREDLLALANDVTDSYLPISKRYFTLLAKIMKKDHLSYADRLYNPIKIPVKHISWTECVRRVIQAYANFSINYAAYASAIVSNPWIDVAPKPGKKSGAYCIRGEKPYILLNFSGTEDDLRTFAHELGHGVHHLLTAENGVLNDETPTTLAEVASEFAENLIFSAQYEAAKTDKEKLHLLIDRVGDMIGSVHRQIAFFKFEERTHHERRDGELSTERLNQIWREEMFRCYGFDIGDDADYLWMGISHIFETPYYVYSYAFAGLVVNNLIKAYQEWDEKARTEIIEDFSDLYLDMLSNTGVEDYVSLLEPFGIDATDPHFWKKGLKFISDYIDEIERLAKKEGFI